MFERFTDRARRVMGLANQEAMRFNHESIGTEHILLGLIKEGSGVAANVLRSLGVDLKHVRLEIERKHPSGHDLVTVGRLPFERPAKKVIELAFEEARPLGHNYVGTEHLLLGLLRENDGIAAQILVEQGLELSQVREEVMKLLGHRAEQEDSAIDLAPGETARTKVPGRKPELADVQELLLGIERSQQGRETAGERKLALTARVRKVMELAFQEARTLGHDYVDTEHVLLALLREGEVIPAQVLLEKGQTADGLRREILRRFDNGKNGGK